MWDGTTYIGSHSAIISIATGDKSMSTEYLGLGIN